MRLRAKLLLPIGMALLGTLVVHLWATRVRENSAADLLAVEHHARQQVEQAMRVQIAFRKQVQEWKNILLRGGDPKDFGAYHRRFLEQETAVAAGLQRLASDARDPTVSTRARAIEHDHRQLGLAYREALDTYMTHRGPDAAQVADRQVRGLARAPTHELEQLVQDIRTGAAERVDAAAWTSSTAEAWLLIFSVALYALIGAALLLLVRRFVSRPAELAARVARGLDRPEDMDMSAVDDDEMGELLLALKELRDQLEEERERTADAHRALLQARTNEAPRPLPAMGADLRQPLDDVLGNVQQLRDALLDAPHQDLADAASESALRLASLVDDLLEASQASQAPEEDRRTPSEPFDVHQVMQQVVGEGMDLAWAKGLQVDWHPPEPIQAIGPASTFADLMWAEVRHAIETAEAGNISIEAWAVEREDHVEVRVDVLHDGVADPADPTSAASVALAATMDGDAGHEQRPEGGTHQWFVVHLRRTVSIDETSVMDELTPVPLTEPRSAPLVAFEATEVGRAILRRGLTPLGLDVHIVDDMETLEGLLELDGYALALVGLDGAGEARRVVEALRAATDRGGHLTALVAIDLEPQLDGALEAGWDDAIARPLTPQALEALVRRWVVPEELAG